MIGIETGGPNGKGRGGEKRAASETESPRPCVRLKLRGIHSLTGVTVERTSRRLDPSQAN